MAGAAPLRRRRSVGLLATDRDLARAPADFNVVAVGARRGVSPCAPDRRRRRNPGRRGRSCQHRHRCGGVRQPPPGVGAPSCWPRLKRGSGRCQLAAETAAPRGSRRHPRRRRRARLRFPLPGAGAHRTGRGTFRRSTRRLGWTGSRHRVERPADEGRSPLSLARLCRRLNVVHGLLLGCSYATDAGSSCRSAAARASARAGRL